MSQTASLSTTDALGAVYDVLGRPGQESLPASIVCSRYWLELDKICLMIGLSDRTIFMQFDYFSGAVNATEINLGEVPNFGNELGLEIVEFVGGVESRIPVELISDARDLPQAINLSASIYRSPDQPTIPILRFNKPLPGTYRFRLYWEPGSFSRPDMDEKPMIPGEGQSFLIALTAYACLADLADKYSAVKLKMYDTRLTTQVATFGELFSEWVTKDVGGNPHRTAFNESRRGTGRYGSPRRPLQGFDFPIRSE